MADETITSVLGGVKVALGELQLATALITGALATLEAEQIIECEAAELALMRALDLLQEPEAYLTAIA